MIPSPTRPGTEFGRGCAISTLTVNLDVPASSVLAAAPAAAARADALPPTRTARTMTAARTTMAQRAARFTLTSLGIGCLMSIARSGARVPDPHLERALERYGNVLEIGRVQPSPLAGESS